MVTSTLSVCAPSEFRSYSSEENISVVLFLAGFTPEANVTVLSPAVALISKSPPLVPILEALNDTFVGLNVRPFFGVTEKVTQEASTTAELIFSVGLRRFMVSEPTVLVPLMYSLSPSEKLVDDTRPSEDTSASIGVSVAPLEKDQVMVAPVMFISSAAVNGKQAINDRRRSVNFWSDFIVVGFGVIRS